MTHHHFSLRNWHKALLFSVTGALTIFYSQWGAAQISIGGVDIPYTQNFNTLASSGTSSTMPAGWTFFETGGDGLYTADNGSLNAADIYSYGSTSNSDRALGILDVNDMKIGANFTNNTGVTITSLLIQFTGEQWRLGDVIISDRLDFQYSTNATSLTTGAWTDVNQLDFIAPINSGVVGALNGNASANRTLTGHTISGLSITNNTVFWIRWNSSNAVGAEDGLAVDDFALTANPVLHYTISNVGGAFSITDTDGNSDELDITQVGSNIRFYAPGRTYSLNSGATTPFPVDIPIAGLTSIVVNAGNGHDIINVGAFSTSLPLFTINGGIDNDVLNLNGDINFVNNSPFNADLQNDAGTPGVDRIIVSSNANLICTGTGTATLKASQSILLHSGASIVTASGNLTVEANTLGTPTPGDFVGLQLNTNARLEVTGTGTATIKGKGGTTGSGKYGIYLSGGDIDGGTTGALTITGTGGLSPGNTNHGVYINGSSASINSAGCNVNIIGVAGGTGTSAFNYGVHSSTNATITAGGTGNVTITGTGGICTGGNNMGVIVGGASTINSSGGNVNVTGTGGGASGAGTHNYGVHVQGGGKITCGTSGIVSVNGTGGLATGNANDGVSIWGVNSLITSSGDSVNVSGQGGGLTTSGSNMGVHLQTSGMISAGNTGAVTINGTGGATTGTNNFGIFVIENGSAITSAGGNVTLNGVGGGSGSSTGNYGILVFHGLVSAGGAGTVTMTGTGGSSSGANNVGIRVSEVNGTVTSGGGDITLTGIEGNGPDGYAISVYSNGTVTTAANGGNITLIGNSINIASTISTNASEGIAIRQYTDGVDMNLGPATNPIGGPLNLSDAELDFVSTTTLLLGQSTTTGTFTISSSITRSALTHIGMYSSEDLIINGGSIHTNGGIVVFDAGDSPNAVKAIQAGVDATADIAYPVGDLMIDINGNVADVSYTQFNVVGGVNLNFASLTFSGSYDPQPSDVFTIVQNDGVDAITGTFSGLPQGATISNFLGSGLPATISYIGGTGNDVVLTVGAPDYLITNSGGILSVVDYAGNGDVVAVTHIAPNIRFAVASRTYSLNGGAVTNFPIDIPLAGLTSVTINTDEGDDGISIGAFSVAFPSLTINGGTGDDFIQMAGDVSFIANANLNLDLQDDDASPGSDFITFLANANIFLSGTGSATLKVSRNILMNTGSSLVAINGNITCEANLQSSSSAGNFIGLSISNALLEITGTGALNVNARGGTVGASQHGVHVTASGDIIGGTTNAITLIGSVGLSSSSVHSGVLVTGSGSTISSHGADVIITGFSNSVAAFQIGVQVSAGGLITAGIGGDVNIEGTGGLVTTSSNDGVRVTGTNSAITSSGGNVSVIGFGGGTGASATNVGVSVVSGGLISAGGSGSVYVEGTGGVTTGVNSFGVLVQSVNSTITSSGGYVHVVGYGSGIGTAASSIGVYVVTSGKISSGGLGLVEVEGYGGAGSGNGNAGINLQTATSMITSSGGNIIVRGEGGGSGGSNVNDGISLNNGVIHATGNGNIQLFGTGGTSSGGSNTGINAVGAASAISTVNGDITVNAEGGIFATGTLNHGFNIATGAEINAGGGGNIIINSIAGPSTGSSNYGFILDGNTTMCITTNGDIYLNAMGGGTGASFLNIGVAIMNSAQMVAGGSGNIFIDAAGGLVQNNNNTGMFVTGENTRITTTDGDINIFSTGGGIGMSADGEGFYLNDGAQVTSTGVGNISITGVGGAGSAYGNEGVVISSEFSAVSTMEGNISLTGIEGNGTSGIGIITYTDGIISSAGGNIELTANSMVIDATIITQSADVTTLNTYSSTAIILSDDNMDPIGGPLYLKDAELDMITTGTLVIGSTNCDTILIPDPITRTASTNVYLLTNGDVLFNGGSIESNGGNVFLDPGGLPYAVRPFTAGNDVASGTLTLLGALAIEINGLNADTDYHQLDVQGSINLGGVPLILSGSHLPLSTESFIIIDNDGVDPVISTFNGLAEGATIPAFLGGVYPATISYVGGTGNDVVITVASPNYLLTTTGNEIIFTDVAGNGEVITLNQALGNGIQFVVPGRNYSLNGGAITNLPVITSLNGMNMVTVNAGGGNDGITVNAFTSMCHLTLNGGTGNDVISMNGDIVFINNANLNIDLQNDDAIPGEDRIIVNNTVNLTLAGLGNAVLKTSRDVYFGNGSSLLTVNGNLTIENNQQATPTTGTFYGITLTNNSLVEVAGTGTLDVKGKGGTISNAQIGVYLFNSAIMRGGTVGNHVVTGTGGATTSNDNRGVQVQLGSMITTNGGNLIINAQGGGLDASAHSHGIHLVQAGVVSAGGMGSVTINASGALTTGIRNHGIHLLNAGSMVTSNGGDVFVYGLAGGTGPSSYNHGVFVQSNAMITAGGLGTVTIEGTGGAPEGVRNDGVICYQPGATITSGGGDVYVTGIGGGSGVSGHNYGVFLDNEGLISAGGMGDVHVNGTGGTTTGARNAGVYVYTNNSAINSSGGDVHIIGQGGGSGESIENFGVFVQYGATISAGGTGNVLVNGTGGTTTGTRNDGVCIELDTATITSSGGNVEVIGQGGGTGVAFRNYGVFCNSVGVISAGGTGNVNVEGTGSMTSEGVRNYGVVVAVVGSMITSSGGSITVDGVGGGTGLASNNNFGTYLTSGAIIAQGNGTISIEGTGGEAAGPYNFGVHVLGNESIIETTNGDIYIYGQGSGIGSASTNNYGIRHDGHVIAGGNGHVHVEGYGALNDGNTNYGLLMVGAAAEIITNNGNILAFGQGGGSGNTNNHIGLSLSGGAQIVAGGIGTTTVEGIAGNGIDGLNMGVTLNGATTLISSNGGNVFVTGQGGGAGGTGQHNYGVNVYAAAQISVGGTGNVTIDGTGGPSAGSNNYGVIVFNPTSAVTSTDGDIHIIAQGGGTGASAGNLGFQVQSQGTIAAGGTGNVLIESTGGATSGAGNHGVLIWHAGTSVTTNGGDIDIIGNGNGILNSTSSVGVYVADGLISTGGEGNVILEGTGAEATGAANHGVIVTGATGQVSTSDGDISIKGIPGGSVLAYGILHSAGANINTTTGGGNIELLANTINIIAPIESTLADTVFISSLTIDTAIVLGGYLDSAQGPLLLSDPELDYITTGSLIIGQNTAGTITVIDTISRESLTNVNLVSGGDVIFDGGMLHTNGGNSKLDPGTSPAGVKPLQYGTDIACGTLTFGSDLIININGTIADTSYDQLNVTGIIDLTGVSLILTGNYSPVYFDTFMIVRNDGVDPVIGIFNGLAEGANIPMFLGTNLSATISYIAGDGNDVVIQVSRPDYAITNINGHLVITDLAGNSDALTISELGANIRFNVPGRNYSYNSGAITSLPADIPLAGIDSITVNAENGNDNIILLAFTQLFPRLDINGGMGDETVTMAGDMIFMPDAELNVDLQNDDPTPGLDRFVVNGNVDLVLSGEGSATIKVSRDVVINAGAMLSTEEGDIFIEANYQPVPSVESFSGVTVSGLLTVTGSGALTVKGKAGQTNNLNHGVYVVIGGDIIGGTSGPVYVEGVSAQSITQSCHGVVVINPGSTISSLGADVEVVGESNGAGGNFHNGVDIQAGGNISVGGSGNVVVHGTGGNSPGTNNNGVRIVNANSSITSSGGNITVTGIGGGDSTSPLSSGISILASGSIIAGGNGSVEVNGTGGPNSGGSCSGISVIGTNSIISSNGGDVIVYGYGGGTGTSATNYGIQVAASGKITAGGMGDVYVEGTGGASEGNTNQGVHISISGATITSSGGNVQVVGYGGGTGTSTNNSGVFVGSTGILSAGNLGTVSVQGIGGLTSGSANNGVHVQTSGSQITSSGGNVNIVGLGGGHTTANTASGVLVETFGVITSGTSGDITIEGQGGPGTGTGHIGVSVINGGMIASDGNISVNGTAGLNGTGNMIGVNLSLGSIAATDSGNIDVEGIGGPGTSNNNHGVFLNSTSGKITSEDGDITVIGQGGGFGASNSNHGIHLSNGVVESTGNGNISVTGNGGFTDGVGNTGLVMNSSSALIQTNSGDIQIIGNGGGTGSSNSHTGIQIINGAEVYAGATGNVLIEGTGGNTTGFGNVGCQFGGNSLIHVDQGDLTIYGNGGTSSTLTSYGIEIGNAEIRGSTIGQTLIQGTGGQGVGTFNYGIFMTSIGGLITSQGGNLEVIGIEGNGASGTGIRIINNTRISTASAGGNIEIKTNSLQCLAGIQTQPSDTLIIQPFTPAADIHLAFGTDVIGGPLHLSDQELDSMVTGQLVIGSILAGDIHIGGSVSRTTMTHVDLISGADILFDPGTLHTNGGNVFIDPGTSPMAFRPISSGADVILDTLSMTGDLAIVIDGLLPDVQHHQLHVLGTIDVSGVVLVLSGSYSPVESDSFVIVNNDGIDMIIGTFNGLAEGDTIFNFLGSDLDAVITYEGGDGNDVVIRLVQSCISPSDVVISATIDTICAGTTITLELESGDLGGATQWHWYSEACGSNPVGTGTSIMVTPADTTTYYVRGEGGCVFNEVCASKTILVHPFPDATIYQEVPDTCYFIDRLFRPESDEITGATYLWDFGSNAIPSSATGYGPHIVYYDSIGPKSVKLVIYPNAEGAQCADSSTVNFIIYNCPGQILGQVLSDMGSPIAGVNVRLFADADTNGIADNQVPIRSIFTPANGAIAMASVIPGNYVLVQTQPSGWVSFFDGDTSPDGDIVPNIDTLDNLIPITIIPRKLDFNNVFIERPAPGSITGSVFNDFDMDQVPDAGEGLAGVTIQLFQDQDANGVADVMVPFASIATNAQGQYTFSAIPVGHYVLVELQPPGNTSVKDIDVSNDNDLVPNTNMMNDTIPVTLTNGEVDANNYFIDIPGCGSVVTNLLDSGPGSLRDALACTQSGDTIRFHPNLAGLTISITSDVLVINSDLVITCDLPSQVTISSFIVGLIEIDEMADVEIRGLTLISGLSPGNTGAAIENNGMLTLHNTTVIRNPLFVSGEYLIRNQGIGELNISGDCFLQY